MRWAVVCQVFVWSSESGVSVNISSFLLSRAPSFLHHFFACQAPHSVWLFTAVGQERPAPTKVRPTRSAKACPREPRTGTPRRYRRPRRRRSDNSSWMASTGAHTTYRSRGPSNEQVYNSREMERPRAGCPYRHLMYSDIQHMHLPKPNPPMAARPRSPRQWVWPPELDKVLKLRHE